MKNNLKMTLGLVLSISFLFSCGGDDDSNMETVNPTDNVYAFTHNGKNYELIKERKTWQQAVAKAIERGGYLAEVNDGPENSKIFNTILNNSSITLSQTTSSDGGDASYVWLGGNDLLEEGNWVWDGNNDTSSTQFWQGAANGNPIGSLYNNWGNEPDNFSNQDGLALALTEWPLGSGSLGNAGQWNDVSAGNTLFFVIEYD